MEKTLRLLTSIFHSFILGIFFGLGILFSVFMAFILTFNYFYPKIMEFLTNIN